MLDTKKLGEAIAEKRGSTSLAEAATQSGIPKSSLGRMERGYGTPSADNLMRVLDWLGATLQEFRADQRQQRAQAA